MPLRFMLVLSAGVVVGFGLSLGRPVQAERKGEPIPVVAAASAADARDARSGTAPSSTTKGTAADPATKVGKSLPWQDARLFAEVLEHVRREYVEVLSDQELMEAAIRGMIADLDPYSAFLDQEQFDEIKISTSGEYSGVGIEVVLENSRVTVVAPIEGTPAARAGVLAGDTLLAVDDMPVDGDDLSDTIDRMRGRVGTPVKITVARQDVEEPLQFTLARANVQVHSVRGELLESGLGYVKISHFSETTAPDLERVLSRLHMRNSRPLEGLVLDLRDNPGGVLEAAIAVSDTFLEEGLIISADGRAADARFQADALPGDAMNGAPIVVLVNGGSASASEIVAGALKDHGRARLVGSRTYGKGSVQTVMPLSQGHAIKLTTSRYYTPSGASIHERGIAPDVVIDARSDTLAPTVDKTSDDISGKAADPTSGHSGRAAPTSRTSRDARVAGRDDRALQRAVSMLKEPGVIRQSQAPR